MSESFDYEALDKVAAAGHQRTQRLMLYCVLFLLFTDDIIGLVVGLFIDDVWVCSFHPTPENPVPINSTSTTIPITTLSLGITPEVWTMVMSALLLPYHIGYIPSVKAFVVRFVSPGLLQAVMLILFLASFFWLIVGCHLISVISSQCQDIGAGWNVSTGLALFAIFTLACFFLTFVTLIWDNGLLCCSCIAALTSCFYWNWNCKRRTYTIYASNTHLVETTPLISIKTQPPHESALARTSDL